MNEIILNTHTFILYDRLRNRSGDTRLTHNLSTYTHQVLYGHDCRISI